jgi:DNA-binding XRE family transcriptional regulator
MTKCWKTVGATSSLVSQGRLESDVWGCSKCSPPLNIRTVVATKLEIKLPRKPSLSRHLRNARIERGLSVAFVAEQVGVTKPCVYFWETGRTKPRGQNMSALCKVLKLPVKATKAMAAA